MPSQLKIEFTFWVFVIISDIHSGVGAHCFGANKFPNLPGIQVNSLFSFVAMLNPSDTVSIHCCEHKWTVIIQVHISFLNGSGGSWAAPIDACVREREVRWLPIAQILLLTAKGRGSHSKDMFWWTPLFLGLYIMVTACPEIQRALSIRRHKQGGCKAEEI